MCQTDLLSEGPLVLHRLASQRRRGLVQELSTPQMLCIASFCLIFTTVSLHLPSETPGLPVLPCLCISEELGTFPWSSCCYAVEVLREPWKWRPHVSRTRQCGLVKYRSRCGDRCPRFKPWLLALVHCVTFNVCYQPDRNDITFLPSLSWNAIIRIRQDKFEKALSE